VLGFSFAGGLALAAAVEPELTRHLAYVVSVGGHHDLERVLKFFVSNQVQTPQGPKPMQAHEYGLVVLLYQRLEHFVPQEDLALMRSALREWLHEDRAKALALAAQRTTPDSERIFQLLLNQRLLELAPELDQIIVRERTELSALSPRGRLNRIPAPVYLLHGAGDSVIPASETSFAELELGSHEHAALISPLLEHVEVSKTAAIGHQLGLVRFMAELL
jgi:pimeloyl-ACP methyl ester carboxylesterase